MAKKTKQEVVEEAIGEENMPQLLVGIFLHPATGGIELVAKDGVDPARMLMNALGNYIDSIRAPQEQKQQSPILRANGPLPPMPRMGP